MQHCSFLQNRHQFLGCAPMGIAIANRKNRCDFGAQAQKHNVGSSQSFNLVACNFFAEALFCALIMRSFTFALFACFSVRPCLERPRLGTAGNGGWWLGRPQVLESNRGRGEGPSSRKLHRASASATVVVQTPMLRLSMAVLYLEHPDTIIYR